MDSNTITPATGLRLLAFTLLCYATGLPSWLPDYLRPIIWLYLVTSDESVLAVVLRLYHWLHIPCQIPTPALYPAVASGYTVDSKTLSHPVDRGHTVNSKTLSSPSVDDIPVYIATPPMVGNSGVRNFPGEKGKIDANAWLKEGPYPSTSGGFSSLEKNFPGEKGKIDANAWLKEGPDPPASDRTDPLKKNFPGEKSKSDANALLNEGPSVPASGEFSPLKKNFPGAEAGDKAWWEKDKTPHAEESTTDAPAEPADKKTVAEK